MIALKSIETDRSGFPTKFGMLMIPDLHPGEVRNNEELYQAVRIHGEAVIVIGEAAFPERLSPDEFERNWRGD